MCCIGLIGYVTPAFYHSWEFPFGLVDLPFTEADSGGVLSALFLCLGMWWVVALQVLVTA